MALSTSALASAVLCCCSKGIHTREIERELMRRADKMIAPLDQANGICVLSHECVCVVEVRVVLYCAVRLKLCPRRRRNNLLFDRDSNRIEQIAHYFRERADSTHTPT